MRRSLLLRLLALSLAVALGAVGGTAVLATYSTTEQLQGQLENSASLLEADQSIFAELLNYAGGHTDWADVEPVVREAARRTGRRIALKTPDGEVIADSARGLGGAVADLPSVPSATIDVAAGTFVLKGGMQMSYTTPAKTDAKTDANARATAGGAGAALDKQQLASDVFSPYWRITPAELSRRKQLAAEALACLKDNGVADAQVFSTPEGVPQIAIAQKQADGTVLITKSDALQNTGCIPEELTAPSQLAAEVSKRANVATIDCFERAGVQYQVQPAGNLDQIVPAKADQPIPAELGDCVRKARSDALAPYVASPAKLYLGSADRFNVFSSEGLLRTGATALGVLLIAALVTVVAGRRLVRPIQALTGAAQRMAAGDRAARVPVSGNDEVSRLGHAFNAMAHSIERNEQQRRVMVSDVAHELRTPLSNIRGYLEAGEDGVVPLDHKLVGSLLEETALLERLVSDLQELALADAGMLRLHPEELDVAELAAQTVAAHRTAADAGGAALELAAGEPAVAVVDPARIRQALGNLVANAVKFTPAGGVVRVSVVPRPAGVEIAVSDTGPGIGEEHLPYVFDRFYRADPSRSRATGGSGLGLAITKHLVEAHGGRVTVSSTAGKGSTFVITLPAG
ncbi:MAG TPA: ATP-binding protein [Kribbellaceae bacterium]|nr:ATP-binding protein [Kribbellaceae bacterium]